MTIRHFTERVARAKAADLVAELDFDDRQRAQGRAITTSGEAVGLFIERGTSLKHGDHLRSADGAVLRIDAKAELLSVVAAALPRDLTRAAYHLGNRHVRLEVGASSLAYQADHVLDDMVRTLGFEVTQELRPFEPEPGAYHRHSHADGHGHSHGDAHAHGHAHGHNHDHDEPLPLIFKVRS